MSRRVTSPLLKTLEDAQSLISRGLVAEALQVIEKLNFDTLLEGDADGEGLRLRLRLLGELCRWREVVEVGGEWLRLLLKSPHRAIVGTLHEQLGQAHLRLGDHRRAESHIRAAVHVATWEVEDPIEAIQLQRLLALMFKNLAYWHQARHELRYAIAAADEIECNRESGALRSNLAVVLLKSGGLGEVPTLLDEAERFLALAEKPHWIMRVHLVRARYLILTNHPSNALEILTPVLATTREQQYSREEAICLEYMGDCYAAQKEFQRALDCYNAALQIADATAPKGDLIPELGHRIGEALVNLGDPNGAILACERGLRVARDTGDRYEECATHRVLAMANWAAGNPRKALRLAAEGIELARSYEIPYEHARALQWAGEARLKGSTPDEQALGRRQLWEARAINERLGLTHTSRHIEMLLGLESQPEPQHDEPGIAALHGIENFDRGALKFGIITCNSEVSEAVTAIQSIAPSRIPVLILGQSGVGKELLAKALHLMSDRRKAPFIAVNCGAVSPNLIDSEFFGHERGAFTGAIASREGLLASAHQGTLFLDEIGELSPSAQSTLLRVLETGELRPLGRDDIRMIDVRVVAATNASLEELVDRGVFRRDLYYRLNGVSVSLPPLQDREEDIRALFRYFWAQAVAASRKALALADDIEPMLCAYAWPGNVRELKNEVARVVALAESGTIVTREAFLPNQRAKSAEALRRNRERLAETSIEREAILRALRAHRGNKAEAARSLDGMKRTTLIYRIQTLGIQPEEYLVSE